MSPPNACNKHSLFQAIDIWMFSGLSFVIAALVEGAFVNNTDSQKKVEVSSTSQRNKKGRITRNQVKTVSRVLFPLSYLIFNVGYWVYYVVSVKV